MTARSTATAAAYTLERLDSCWAVEKKQTTLATHATPMAPCILTRRQTNYLDLEGLVAIPRYVRTKRGENGPPHLGCLIMESICSPQLIKRSSVA
ncbi:hypothetical protein GGP41_003697 [Bipolaris sorokiniana]|uniref:Uncharacterized protein n=1 Tax=Cochliobolus sativus TaxID=45130 RepID=A0A8H6DS18_COCSA|nr:hypothetical protein GGP41_003697 [Bipolaris sorokiniana]